MAALTAGVLGRVEQSVGQDALDTVEALATRTTASQFQLPEGYAIELVAGPPLVRYPLFGCFDDRGRLYVAEGTGRSVPGAELVNQKLGRITRLEDLDGDGHFDTSTLYADDLVFPQGVLWHDGVVYVASHPAIWRLEDTDGDGRADRREELFGKFNFNGNGCDIHGPFLGPDGRLYWTDGRHGYRIDRPDGTCLEGLAARIWRSRLDGGELERVAGGGFDNPVELAWTKEGEMLGTMDQGAGDCLLHYIEGGVYPEEHPCVKEFVRTGPLLGVVKRYPVELPAALCGTMRYRSEILGAEFRDTLITTHYMTHKLVRSQLIRDGATFRAEDHDFLTSTDTHLRLTDVLEDADGSLLTIDMGAWFTYGFLGNVLPRPDRLGAIYRIRHVGAPAPVDPRGLEIPLDTLKAEQLVELLKDGRPAVRDRATDQLVRRGADGVGALSRCVLRTPAAGDDHEQVRAWRRRALWALCRIDASSARAAVRAALREFSPEDDAEALMVAAYAAGLHRDVEAADALLVLLNAEHPWPLQRKAAESLGRLRLPRAVPVLLGRLRRPVDRFLEHSILYALIQINDRNSVLSGLADDSLAVQRAALIALDQMADGRLTREMIARLAGAHDTPLQKAVLDVVRRRPDWADVGRNIVRQWLGRPMLDDEQQAALTGFLTAGEADSELQQIIAATLRDASVADSTRLLLLGVMRETRLRTLPETWVESLRDVLRQDDATLRSEAIAAIRTRRWRLFDEQLQAISRDARQNLDARLAALECLAGAGTQFDSVSYQLLLDQLSLAADPVRRLVAARTLAASPLDRDQFLRLASQIKEMNAMLLRLILPAFTANSDEKVGKALVNALNSSQAAEALKTAELDTALKNFPPSVQREAVALRERLIARQEGQAAYLKQLVDELASLNGSADAGKEIFLAPKNNCFACHRAVGRGGTIGPDLTKIGQLRTRSELLESIIFPSFSVAPQYQTHTLATVDGRTAMGLVTRETAQSLVLRKPDLSEWHVPRADVQELIPSTVSLMPDGLERTLTRQQLADLLEFLCQQR